MDDGVDSAIAMLDAQIARDNMSVMDKIKYSSTGKKIAYGASMAVVGAVLTLGTLSHFNQRAQLDAQRSDGVDVLGKVGTNAAGVTALIKENHKKQVQIDENKAGIKFAYGLIRALEDQVEMDGEYSVENDSAMMNYLAKLNGRFGELANKFDASGNKISATSAIAHKNQDELAKIGQNNKYQNLSIMELGERVTGLEGRLLPQAQLPSLRQEQAPQDISEPAPMSYSGDNLVRLSVDDSTPQTTRGGTRGIGGGQLSQQTSMESPSKDTEKKVQNNSEGFGNIWLFNNITDLTPNRNSMVGIYYETDKTNANFFNPLNLSKNLTPGEYNLDLVSPNGTYKTLDVGVTVGQDGKLRFDGSDGNSNLLKSVCEGNAKDCYVNLKPVRAYSVDVTYN